jgi:hypothetical protein
VVKIEPEAIEKMLRAIDKIIGVETTFDFL